MLTIPYEDETDLAWQMDWLRGEMVELAEGEGGAITAEFRDAAIVAFEKAASPEPRRFN